MLLFELNVKYLHWMLLEEKWVKIGGIGTQCMAINKIRLRLTTWKPVPFIWIEWRNLIKFQCLLISSFFLTEDNLNSLFSIYLMTNEKWFSIFTTMLQNILKMLLMMWNIKVCCVVSLKKFFNANLSIKNIICKKKKT